MPLYTYVCHCGNIEEQLNSIEDRDNARCTKCGIVMRRIIQAPPLIKKDFEDSNR